MKPSPSEIRLAIIADRSRWAQLVGVGDHMSDEGKPLRYVSDLSCSGRRKHGERGVALILVLGLLVLVSGLIIGFLSRSTTERTETAAFFESSRTENLADYAVSIVQAQIAHASNSDNGWASQPGMVRSYHADGSLRHGYKLFSDDTMVLDSINASTINEMVNSLQGWQSSPALFTDLNAPIFLNPTGATPADRDPVYPILDGSAVNGGIEGFSINTSTVGASANQPVPMPAKWLYVLKDGTAVAGVEAGGTVTVVGATASNPIVGRIAFWTDDETSKVNINTAAHGYHWDIPRTFSEEDRLEMAMRQPTLREFQRYPGHPATTSLWPVLGHLFSSEASFAEAMMGGSGTGGLTGVNPRVVGGGSAGGTVSSTAPISLITPPPRLYSAVEEMLFLPNRSPRPVISRAEVEKAKFFLTAHSQAPEVNLHNLPRMAIWPINAGSKTPSVLDELIKFCSTISDTQYSLIRNNPVSGTADMDLSSGHNQRLYNYVTALMRMAVPGFGTASFAQKYPSGEFEQITTQIFDYIRSANLYSTALGASPYTGTGANNEIQTLASRVGQVTPLRIGNTKGFGRIPVLSKAMFQLYVCGVETNQGRWAPNVTTGATRAFSGGAAITPTTPADGGPGGLAALLSTTGVGGQAQLLTNAIIYFDTFDPNLGYTYPRYNFDIEVTLSGSWQVNGVPVNLPTGTQTIQIRRDQGSIYDAGTHQFRDTWMGRFLGGHLGPHWVMQNYSYANSSTRYPLISSTPFMIHSPVAIEDANQGGSGGARATLPAASLPNAEKVNFSGGTVEAVIKVDGETVQTYTFTFPSATRPKPMYAPRTHLPSGSGSPSFGLYPDETVINQLSVSSDFRNRLNSRPMAYHNASAGFATIADIGLTPPYDTVFSLEPAWGDKRLIGAKSVLTSGSTAGGSVSFVPHKDYSNEDVHLAVDLRTDPFGVEKKMLTTLVGRRAGRILNITYGQNAMPDIPSLYDGGVTGINGGGTFLPDFDNGTLHMPDDAYVNRPDEGSATDQTLSNGRHFAWYWDQPNFMAPGGGTVGINNSTFYSPNKQMPSAVMFGSLPTGVMRNLPWQTLLFRPDPGNHPGAAPGLPADHLLLDLFWMPVVEPYAISEPFATSGKINMNYQILPYSYIQRSSGMRAALHSQKLVSIRDSDAFQGTVNPVTGYSHDASNTIKGADQYKLFSEGAITTGRSISGINYRKKLNVNEANGTLRAFEDRFAAGDIFRSETEICNVSLIPEGETYSASFESSYWGTRRLTGDNSREMPYAHLLPRLTTRSNTYTVYYRVQSLRKLPSTPAGEWDETRDRVVAEQRGSRIIERYIDPANTSIPDYLQIASTAGSLNDAERLSNFYRWRTLNSRIFAP